MVVDRQDGNTFSTKALLKDSSRNSGQSPYTKHTVKNMYKHAHTLA